MRYIKLKTGHKVLVDNEDYNTLKKYNWFYGSKGYAIKNKTKDSDTRLMHRFILGLHKNDPIVDHINGNPLDNRKKNLRLCTQKQNTKNGSRHKDGSSNYKGVHYHKLTGKWRAQICIDYKRKSLGLFNSQIDAAKEYNKAATKYHCKFAKLNNVNRKVG